MVMGAALQVQFEEQLQVEGTKAAVLSTMRHTPVQAYLDGYRRLGQTNERVLIGWGLQDEGFPHEHHVEAQAAMPHAKLFPVGRAGHLPMLEQPRVVLDELLPFPSPIDAADG